MPNIPVTFTLNGKEYKGHFSPVMGASSNSTFHLIVDGHYFGQLWYVNSHPGFNGLHAVKEGWRFASNQHPELSELASEFGDLVVAWYE